MRFHILLTLLLALLCAPSAIADEVDAEGYPVLYVRGEKINGWGYNASERMARTGDTYTITLPSLDGQFKIGGKDWNINYGSSTGEVESIADAVIVDAAFNGKNFRADNLRDVTITFTQSLEAMATRAQARLTIFANGHQPAPKPVDGLSGTLPVLYINVYNEGTNDYNNEVIDRNLAHKNYFAGEYWLDLNGCEWIKAEGAKAVGSADEPLPLEIKARGNYTRTGFSKKPFKLKLGKKQSLLGLSKSKHFALLAHADDGMGYLRNFTGFNLGRRIGLPWTPWQQPVEVVINGDYRGLYFLTESIRIEEERINIAELDDNVSDPELISGGYLVELDNYDEENQIRMAEKSCVGGYLDMLRITWDTPEVYSDLQKRFVTEQFAAMNDYVGNNDNGLWSYLDLDDAVRYYIVEEIITHTEAYHGSTYLFRDRGEGQKWHFSPLWDCGNAFNGDPAQLFYKQTLYGNTWIPSMAVNDKFIAKLRDTWKWFMGAKFDGLFDDINTYTERIAEAAKADHQRWKDARLPDSYNATPVRDNSNITERRDVVLAHLNAKLATLRNMWGNYDAVVAEPARDTTPAAPLPNYAQSGLEDVLQSNDDAPAVYYNLQGLPVAHPTEGGIYIVRKGSTVSKVVR